MTTNTKALTVNEARQIAIAANFGMAYQKVSEAIADNLLVLALEQGHALNKESLAKMAAISHLNLKLKTMLHLQMAEYNTVMGEFTDAQPAHATKLQEELKTNGLLDLLEKEYNVTNEEQLHSILEGMGIQLDGH